MSKSMFSRIFHLLVLLVLSLVLLGGCGGGSSGGGGVGGGDGKDVDIAALNGVWKGISGSGTASQGGNTLNLTFVSASMDVRNVTMSGKNAQAEVPSFSFLWKFDIEDPTVAPLQISENLGTLILVPEGKNMWRSRVADNGAELGIVTLTLRSADQLGMNMRGKDSGEGITFDLTWNMNKEAK